MITASVSKLDVLEALLSLTSRAHTDLSADEDQLATAMIENSDNDVGPDAVELAGLGRRDERRQQDAAVDPHGP